MGTVKGQRAILLVKTCCTLHFPHFDLKYNCHAMFVALKVGQEKLKIKKVCTYNLTAGASPLSL